MKDEPERCPVTGLDCITCERGVCVLARKAHNARVLDAFDRMDRAERRAFAELRAEVERRARQRW